ncbi:MAG: BTAD domain-containing putative transcriptional regulator [Ilumatobacteraceae bacterium]
MLTVHVLGPVEVRRDGQPVDLGGPQPRAIVAHLALEAGHVVSVERLIDRLWGDDPPSAPLGTLQSYISRLRRAVEPARAAGAAPQVLVSEAPGYVLRIAPEQIDAHQFTALVSGARRDAAAGNPVAALEGFEAALALWRGPALAGVGGDDSSRSAVVRLEEERLAAIEDRFDTLLALGRHVETVPALQAAVDDHPLRERLWALLALALYRSGRQADALRALSAARERLLDELGLDPGPALRELENRILAQDPSLVATQVVPTRPRAAPVAEQPVAPSVELVGRGREWQALVGALDAALSGTTQLVLVEGEPGIGKSTLCERFVAHAQAAGWRTAVGRCVESGLAPSLWPCIEIVRAMLHGETSDDLDSSADASNDELRRFALGGAVGAGLKPIEMAQQFVSLIDELGGEPWVFLLDDLHWADRATLDVMRLVLERLAKRRVVVLGAHRPPALVPQSLLGEALGALHRSAVTTRVEMSPLGTTDVGRLMELTTGVAPTDEVAERVRSRAAGNPLFVAELARLAGEQGLTVAGVPDAIRDVVRGRLAGLPERATAELEVAAVLGERFDLRTAMAASERDPDSCLDALDAAIVTRILVPDGDGFRFAHALVRDAVLAELSALRLARLHHRAAEAILATRGDGPDEAEPIAYHRLAAAALTDPVEVARAAVRASDVARWRSALDTADWFADQALDALSRAPRTPALLDAESAALEALISSARRRGDPDRVRVVVDRLGELADRSGSQAARALHIFMTWGPVDETDDLAEVAEGVERARRFAEVTTDPYATVAVRFVLGSYAMLVGHIDEAHDHLAIAIEAAGGPDPDQRPAHVPYVILPLVAGMVEALRGDERSARDHTYRRAAAWLSERIEVDQVAPATLAFNRALIDAMLANPQAVHEALHGVRHSGEAGFIGQQRATCDVLLGWARARLGDPAGAEQARAAMDEIDRGVERIMRGFLRTMVADAFMSIDDDRAIGLLEAARRESESRGEVFWLSETLRLQGLANVRFGDGQLVNDLLDQAEQIARSQGCLLVLERIERSRRG